MGGHRVRRTTVGVASDRVPGPKSESPVMRQYTHLPLGQEINSISGYYVTETEKRVSFGVREVLVATGHMRIDNSCCGVTGCGFAVVPGYILRWKESTNDNGEPVSEVEPVRDAEQRDTLRNLILKAEMVQQVNFW